MFTTESKIEALERRIAELEGREVANRALLTVVARTVAQTGVASIDDVAQRIENWDRFFEPARTNNLPGGHTPGDALRREFFHSALEHFFAEVRRALPDASTGNTAP